MKLLITGGREYVDAYAIATQLEHLGIGESDTVIHGDCRGADRTAAGIANTLGAKVVPYPR